MSEEPEEATVEVEASEIQDILEGAVPMPPVTVVGGHAFTGVNPGLVTDEVVTTVELLALTPSPEGDVTAIFTLIMEPALAEALGINSIPIEEL